MDNTGLHGFIKFCKLLRGGSSTNKDDTNVENALSSTDVGSVVEVLRLLRAGFASKNTRTGEAAEGLQNSFIEGSLLESAARNRKIKQQQQQQRNSDDNDEKNQNGNDIEPTHYCTSSDAAQVLLFDRAVLNDSQLLHHSADFMTLFEKLRRRERLLSSNQWCDGETLPLRLSSAPTFNILPVSTVRGSTGKINEWQQYTSLLLASCGVWSRSPSAENYLRVENIIGASTGAFDPHESLKASSSSSSDVTSLLSMLASDEFQQQQPCAATLPSSSTWRLSGMLSAALCRAASGSLQQAFNLFNKVVVTTIEKPPHRPTPTQQQQQQQQQNGKSINANNNSGKNLLTPLTVARFISEASRIAKLSVNGGSTTSTTNPNSRSSSASGALSSNNYNSGKRNYRNNNNNNANNTNRKPSQRVASLALAIANFCDVSTIDSPIDAHQLFESACISPLSSEDPPVLHVHGPLNVPIQDVSFDVNGGAAPGVSVTANIAQEPEHVAMLSWARRVSRAIWQNENVGGAAGTAGGSAGGGTAASADGMVGSGIRRPLHEWIALAIAVRIADISPQISNTEENKNNQRNNNNNRDEHGNDDGHDEDDGEDEDENDIDELDDKNNSASAAKIGDKPTVPLVVPQSVQHVTIDTSSGSDDDLFNVNNTADIDPTSLSPMAKALAKTHLQSANAQANGIRNKPGTVAGRRLLQRALEAVFPKPSSRDNNNNNNNNNNIDAASTTSPGSDPSSKAKRSGASRQYPTSLDNNNNNNNSSRTASPSTTADPITATVFGSEFANFLATTIKQLRLVGTPDAAAGLASIVGDARAASRLFKNSTNNNNNSSNSDPSTVHAKDLLQTWNRHRGYRSTYEHGSAHSASMVDAKNIESSQQQQQQQHDFLPPQQILLARFMGRCLEESLRHTAAVSSAIVAHSVARTCTEVPAALKNSNNNNQQQHSSSSSSSALQSIPELKPAETTLSPGVWSVFSAVTQANELVQATKKLIAKLADEEEHVRAAMNQSVGMSALDDGMDNAKRNFSLDLFDVQGAEKKDPEQLRAKSQQRTRVLNSNNQKSADDGKAESINREQPVSVVPPLDNGSAQQQPQQQQLASHDSFKLKSRPKLFTKDELMELTEQELDDVRASLTKAQATLKKKIEETKLSDQEASAALSRAEMLVREREIDLQTAEGDLTRENEEFQHHLQSHLEELVDTERSNLHNVERHSRHLWRVEGSGAAGGGRSQSHSNNNNNNKNKKQDNFSTYASSPDEQIDVDAFLQRDSRFAFLMDEEELEAMYQGHNNDTNNTQKKEKDDEDNVVSFLEDDILSNHFIVDDYRRQQQQERKKMAHLQETNNANNINSDKKSTSPPSPPSRQMARRKSQIHLAPCCVRKKRKIHRIQSSIATVRHSLMGVPFAGWSAGVGQQLSIAANSIEAPPTRLDDGLPDGVEWSHIIAIDTFEAGAGKQAKPSAAAATGAGAGASSEATAALIELLSAAETATLRDSSNTLLPPPFKSSGRNIAKMTGESALYVVGTSVAIPSSRRITQSDDDDEDSDEYDEELLALTSNQNWSRKQHAASFKGGLRNVGADADVQQENDDAEEAEIQRKFAEMSSGSTAIAKARIADILKKRYNHGFAGLIALNDTTKIDPTLLQQQQKQNKNLNTSNTTNASAAATTTTTKIMGVSSVVLAVADNGGKRKNRFVQLDVKSEVVY